MSPDVKLKFVGNKIRHCLRTPQGPGKTMANGQSPRPAQRRICYRELMQLVINGKAGEYGSATVDALVDELGMKGDRVAVELNREILPRAQWAAQALQNGDKLEIVHFVGGG